MKIFVTMVLAALAAVCTPGATGATPQALSAQIIRFDDLTPTGFVLKQSWNALGMDSHERIYIGFTSLRPDQREDFLLFRYDPSNGQRRFLGSFIDAAERAGNLMPGEEIPKGHTRMIEVDGQMYMGSQGFHDFKGSIDALPLYRGAHLFAYDPIHDRLEDLASRHSGGVIVPQQGIIALSVVPERNLLVGLTHPLGDIILFDVESGRLKTTPGIPWTLGSPVSREIVVARTGMIYVSRGSEEPALRDKNHAIWAYNPSTESLARTPFTFKGGFWNGQTATRDGRFIYISTANGELYRLETDRGTFTHLGHFLPQRDQEAGVRVNWL